MSEGYFSGGDRYPGDSWPTDYDAYRKVCRSLINPDLPEALVDILLASSIPMSRWGRISDLMVQAFKYGLDEGRNG